MEQTYYVMSQASADCIRKYGTVGQRMKYLWHRAKSPKQVAHKLFDTPWYVWWFMEVSPTITVKHTIALPCDGKAYVLESPIEPFCRDWTGRIVKDFGESEKEWKNEPNPGEVMAFLNETADLIEGKTATEFRRNLLRDHPEWLEIKQISSFPTFHNWNGRTNVRYIEPSVVRKMDGSVVGEPTEKVSNFGFKEYTDNIPPRIGRLCSFNGPERYALE